jgi:hypothetical protein
MNNIHYNNNIYELIEILVEEHFGKEVTKVGLCLLSNGPMNIQEIKKILNYDFIRTRNALIILMQNRLVNYEEIKKKEIIENVYEFDVESALNYLRFPKILYLINHKFDSNAVMIFEEFMQFGILSANQISEQVTYKLEQIGRVSASTTNNIKIRFLKLIEEGFITQCNKKKINELKSRSDKANPEMNTDSKKKTKKEEINQQMGKKKSKMIFDDFEEQKAKISSPVGKKSLADLVIEDDNPLIFDKEKNKYYYFYMNLDKIITELKVQIVIDYINQKLKGQAAMVASVMLRKDPLRAFKEGKSTPISIEEITKQITFSSGGAASKEKISTKQNAIKEIVELMSREENNYVIPWGFSDTEETFSLNLEGIAQSLKVQTLEKIVEHHFSQDHVRIYRLLSKCGPLDAKNIMEICLMPYKESSACLNQLVEEGLLETQPINVKGPNIIFFNVNTKNNLDLMIAKIYKVCILLIY